MSTVEVKLLNGEAALLNHLDVIFSHHGIYAIMGVIGLWMLLIVWVIIDVARRRAKGIRIHRRPVIFIQTPALPPREEPPSAFPLWQQRNDPEHSDD